MKYNLKKIEQCLFGCKACSCEILENKPENKDTGLKLNGKVSKLIMTLLVKNEEDIIEKNIRFHAAMGVDGFIVTNHNSTDNTLKILEKLKEEGLVLEIVNQTDPRYLQNIWVADMIRIAKNKYNADWVINADADEFFYSKCLDLKKSISKEHIANALYIKQTRSYPDNTSDDFFTCPYFITSDFHEFEAKMLGIYDNPKYYAYIDFVDKRRVGPSPKVIHKTEGFLDISMGNHDVKLENKIAVEFSDIILYHYSIKNLKGYESKCLNYKESAKSMPGKMGGHIKYMIQQLETGNAQKHYENMYNDAVRKFLIENGKISIDYSVYNYLKYLHLLDETKIHRLDIDIKPQVIHSENKDITLNKPENM